MTETVNDMNCIITSIDVDSAGMLKDLSFQLKNKIENLYMVLGTTIENKVNLSVAVSDNLVKDKNLNASSIIRELSAYIKGSGGGQPFFATAGGKDPDGIPAALLKAKEIAEKAGKENK